MTLRRYAPLALSALALACQPKLDERANATTVEYALFNPPTSIPTPNDIAFSAVSAFLPGGAYASAPCNVAPTPQAIGLCAYARAGGFPAPSPVKIGFVRGTLADTGVVSYAPSPDPMDPATLAFAGASLAPTLGIVDLTSELPVTTATPALTAASGELALTPPGGAWTAGHKYAVLVLGGSRGPTTAGGLPYVAMPPFYILREAVIADLDLSKPENQGLFPGDAAAKAASGTALEPLRAGYRTLYEVALPAFTLLNLPFEDVISLQTFQIAPGGTITIGDGTDPADAAVTGGAVAPLDAFTLSSTVSSATVQAVTFALTEGDTALTNLFVSSSATCTGTGTTLGTSGAPAVGDVAIPLTNWLSVGNVSSVPLYVCATTKAPGAATNVSGAVTSVTTFAGTGFTSTGTDTSAVLTVNP
jgi:hypothetical protein